MGDKINLTLDIRDEQGKKVAKLRKEGYVPGVVYGQGFDPILVKADYPTMEKATRAAGRHSAVHLTIENKKKIALIKDIDQHPTKARIRHVSFHAVKAGDKVEAEIPIHLTGKGESEAEKAGLIVLQAIEFVEVKAKPADLPESLDISIAHLASHEDKILLKDIKLPEGVEFADMEHDFELVVANVYEPAALEAANEAAAGDASEEDISEVEAEHGEDTSEDAEAGDKKEADSENK